MSDFFRLCGGIGLWIVLVPSAAAAQLFDVQGGLQAGFEVGQTLTPGRNTVGASAFVATEGQASPTAEEPVCFDVARSGEIAVSRTEFPADDRCRELLATRADVTFVHYNPGTDASVAGAIVTTSPIIGVTVDEDCLTKSDEVVGSPLPPSDYPQQEDRGLEQDGAGNTDGLFLSADRHVLWLNFHASASDPLDQLRVFTEVPGPAMETTECTPSFVSDTRLQGMLTVQGSGSQQAVLYAQLPGGGSCQVDGTECTRSPGLTGDFGFTTCDLGVFDNDMSRRVVSLECNWLAADESPRLALLGAERQTTLERCFLRTAVDDGGVTGGDGGVAEETARFVGGASCAASPGGSTAAVYLGLIAVLCWRRRRG